MSLLPRKFALFLCENGCIFALDTEIILCFKYDFTHVNSYFHSVQINKNLNECKILVKI